MIVVPEINENVVGVIWKALCYFKVKVTRGTVIECIKTCPENISLKSICDLFNDLNIPNYAVNIDSSDLYILDEPFIAYLDENQGKVSLIYSINRETVIYSDSLRGRKTITTQQFLNIWTGVAIIIEPNELSGEADYNERRNNEIIKSTLLPFSILILSITIFYWVVSNKSYHNGIHDLTILFLCLTHAIGLFFSFLLIRLELNLKNKFTEKFCHLSAHFDCNAITKSNASKIFGIITWADAGAVYFAGGLAVIFFFPIDHSIRLLTLFSIFTLPFPFLSILYQWLTIKKWCPLCLSIQFILVTEFILTAPGINLTGLNISVLIPCFLVFSIIFLIVLYMKLLINSEQEKVHLKLKLMTIKHDSDFFLHKLKSGERIDIPFNKSALIFGNMQSEITISIFLSFNCSSCVILFETIRKMIENTIKIKIQFVFSSPNDDMSEKLLKIISSKMGIENKNEAFQILKNWYISDTLKKVKMLNNYERPADTEEYEAMIRYNAMIFQIGEITKVPLIYINGFPLPSIYSVEEISYHIPELIKTKCF